MSLHTEYWDGVTSEYKKLSEPIAKQMSGFITCPACSYGEQTMSTYGDQPGELFCPHCNLQVTFSFRASHDIVKKFIKEPYTKENLWT